MRRVQEPAVSSSAVSQDICDGRAVTEDFLGEGPAAPGARGWGGRDLLAHPGGGGSGAVQGGPT